MSRALVLLSLLLFTACEDKPSTHATTTTSATPSSTSTTTVISTATASALTPTTPAAPSAAPAATFDAAALKFDPKKKCPTGQMHFFLEGDFCRRRCLSNSDCAARERCSPMEYPFVVDGGVAGTARFCEGT